MMRCIEPHPTEYTHVTVTDEPGPGGACHEYVVSIQLPNDENAFRDFLHVKFQKGAIKEYGVNGVQNEDLLAIVIDRLQSFQDGPFACPANQTALLACETALIVLRSRTSERKDRGVEGKSEK